MTIRKVSYAKNSNRKGLLLRFLKGLRFFIFVHLRLGYATTCLNPSFVPQRESPSPLGQQFC